MAVLFYPVRNRILENRGGQMKRIGVTTRSHNMSHMNQCSLKHF